MPAFFRPIVNFCDRKNLLLKVVNMPKQRKAAEKLTTNREQAREKGEMFFEGTVCNFDGTTKRYVKSKRCYRCIRDAVQRKREATMAEKERGFKSSIESHASNPNFSCQQW